MIEVGVCRIEGQRLWIVKCRCDTGGRQMFLQLVSLIGSDDVKVINMITIGSDLWGLDHLDFLRVRIAIRHSPARFGPRSKMREFRKKNCGLQTINRLLIPSIMLALSAVPSKGSRPIGQLIVLRHNTTRIAIGAEFPG